MVLSTESPLPCSCEVNDPSTWVNGPGSTLRFMFIGCLHAVMESPFPGLLGVAKSRVLWKPLNHHCLSSAKRFKATSQDFTFKYMSCQISGHFHKVRKIPAKLLTGPSNHQIASSNLEQSQSEGSSHTFAKVKGRMSLGAKLLQVGRTEVSQVVGPIAGVLFISIDKLAFCGDKSIVKLTSRTGDLVRFPCKVVIPLSEIQKVSQGWNVKKASQKYLQVVTMDDFEFWFMGFLSIQLNKQQKASAWRSLTWKWALNYSVHTMNLNMRLLPGPLTHVDGSLTSNEQGKVDSVLSTINKLARRKLTIGAAILLEEDLLKTSKCCLYTTGGPIAGRLFICTKRMAFCSNEPIAKFAYPSGESVTFYYKVAIPLRKVKRANQSENVEKPS
ncbi:hypothetical protein Cgig2_026779 [Carnegiea gigantea]|uniref:GRAM domain-containing protein n=1 Tax=Carnegiea gigantea TaxID=171969 RepID=A0A9Q1GLG6_9CARY|nr:hypothetical protein Cgig2_026779 [Carnegiea gigantea]